MATTENIVLGNGGNTYSFSFPYLKTEDVRVELQEFDASQPVGSQVISTDNAAVFTVDSLNPTQIIFSAIGVDTVYQTAPDGDVKVTSSNGYPVRVRIYRSTQPDSTPATFFAGSAIRAQDLNDNFDQILYIMQENENELISITTGGIGDNAISTASLQNNSVTSAKIADGTIVDADVNASAAIAGTKISPNFGAQNTVTTGNNTAAGFIPTSNTVPTNGLYLPSANNVALATNNTGVLFISSDGKVGLNESDPSSYSVFGDNLVIKGTAHEGISIISGVAGSGNILFGDTDAEGRGFIIYYHGDNSFSLGANGSTMLRVESTGTVNITGAGTAGSTQAVSFNGSAPVDSLIVDSSGDVHIGNDLIVNSINGGQLTGSRNRIINGDMRIDQRNAGAAVTIINSLTGGTYTLDRFLVNAYGGGGIDVQQVTDAPAGFNNSMKCTVSTADTNLQNVNPPSIPSNEEYFIQQMIEGYNCADLGFGTANAKTVTISFWVKASIAGSYGFALKNSGAVRSYPTSYSISAGEVNTWVQKTITIAGDTSGTWNKTDGMGIEVYFSLGAAPAAKGTANTWATAPSYSAATGSLDWISTNGATFYITGVQLEPGTVATPFEHRSYGQELALCQRYYSVLDNVSTLPVVNSIGASRGFFKFPTTMRSASPSCTFAYDLGSGATWAIGYNGGYQNGNHSSISGFSVKASAEFI